jgi:hypothetical protein
MIIRDKNQTEFEVFDNVFGVFWNTATNKWCYSGWSSDGEENTSSEWHDASVIPSHAHFTGWVVSQITVKAST